MAVFTPVIDRVHDRLDDVNTQAAATALLNRQVESGGRSISWIVLSRIVDHADRQDLAIVELEMDMDVVVVGLSGILVAVGDDVDDDLVEHKTDSHRVVD